jgi:glycosyltransferase involved in cell wall biosynthesis
MHILFIHPNFPAQFGQVALHLARHHGFRCTFASEKEIPSSAEIQHLRFQARGGARKETHYCSRTFENQTWKSHALFEALQQQPHIRPDLIVAHSGFVSPLFLRELYPQVPQIGYFEFFYHATGSDMDFRHDLPPPSPLDVLRLRARNAQLLLDLENCDAGYSPTEFQRLQLPVVYQTKVRRIFDGIDTDFWHRSPNPSRAWGGITIPAGHKVLTYVSRGFESIRGFDIFLQVADRVCRARQDVQVLVVGEDRIAYGGDVRYTEGKTFKEWAIARHRPDLTRIHFLGRLPPSQLAEVFSLSDLHLYLTVPFVLSWSLFNALSCSCLVLASDTAPCRELIQNGRTGLLTDFFNIEQWVERVLDILDRLESLTPLRQAGRKLIETEYALPTCLGQMLDLYRSTVG